MNVEEIQAPGIDAELRSCVRSWGVTQFTQVQVMALEAGVAAGESQIVCAPTSAGKTLVAEIAILAALCRGKRCLYLVSHKALADQKYLDFVQRFGEEAPSPRASVGLSTGDRDEGEVSPHLLIATYEKALALLLSGQLELSSAVVIADELQIVGDEGRGPNIETLCAIFRRHGVDQFVGLTATVGNAAEIAAWLNCRLVSCLTRDVDLHQEIWNGGSAYRVRFGQDVGEACHEGEALPVDTIAVVKRLISMGRGPVLVFTESRSEASTLAESYSQSSVRTADGLALAQQLELFSEPTESSQQLQNNAQKRVAFHTADLTAQERQVVEKGFVDASFDVCFATSTLAAGVNFPFKSVVFPKLTYQWGDRDGRMLARGDYRNMSGRAGRLGLHPEGFAILLPKNRRETAHANELILPDNDNVDSQLIRLSMRRTVLALVAFGVATTEKQLGEFFRHSFYWHQIQERNPLKLQDVVELSRSATAWLIEQGLVEVDLGSMFPTPFGKAVAQSGLLPATAIAIVETLKEHKDAIEADIDQCAPGLIHLICCSPEFGGERPSRFLPFPIGRQPVNSVGFMRSQKLFCALDRTDSRTVQSVHALVLFARGEAERSIRHQTNIGSGQLHRLATDVAWVFDGLRKIASVPELGFSQVFTNKLAMLARQIQWGAPPEALDILRVAQKEGVPGFGRQRAMALLKQGIETFDQLLASAKEKLSSAVGSERRISALLSAVAASLGLKADRYRKVHTELAEKLGIADIVQQCDMALGTEYEIAIKSLLDTESGWTVMVVDDGKQQNVPDLLVSLGSMAALIECKTTTKNPPLIKKDDAFAVLQKAVDFEKAIHRVTLGKPGFDEHSKKKVHAANDIALVEHDVFIEGMLRLRAGKISPEDFLRWLALPGLTEVDRLGGTPTYSILRE